MHSHTLLTLSLSLLALVRDSISQSGMPSPPTAATTVVMIPGAFHVQSTMDQLGAQLQQYGYNTFTASLVTVNGPGKPITDDVTYLQSQVLDPLIGQQGRDVVLYVHSYAGFPSSVAIDGYSKTTRLSKGLAGGILGLIYQSAFIPLKGATLVEMIGGKYAPWQALNNSTGLINVIDPVQTFYADVPAPLSQAAVDVLYGQSIVSFNSPSNATYWGSPDYNDRRAYIRTGKDMALPPFAQDLFLNGSGVAWDVHRLDNSSHSPFLSQPQNLALLVSNLTVGFEASYVRT